jgi:hypothetical protein
MGYHPICLIKGLLNKGMLNAIEVLFKIESFTG